MATISRKRKANPEYEAQGSSGFESNQVTVQAYGIHQPPQMGFHPPFQFYNSRQMPPVPVPMPQKQIQYFSPAPAGGYPPSQTFSEPVTTSFQPSQKKVKQLITSLLAEALRQNSTQLDGLLQKDKLVDWKWTDERRSRPKTLLHYAVSAQLETHVLDRVCKLMRQNNADLNTPDWSNLTALMFAAKNNFGKAVTVLLDNGAMLEQITEAGSILNVLAGTTQFSLKLSQSILSDPRSRSIINSKDKFGRTPLEVALMTSRDRKHARWTYVAELLKRNATWPSQDVASDLYNLQCLFDFVGNDVKKVETARSVLQWMPNQRLRNAFLYIPTPLSLLSPRPPTLFVSAIRLCHHELIKAVIEFAADSSWNTNCVDVMIEACHRGPPHARVLFEAGADLSQFAAINVPEVVPRVFAYLDSVKQVTGKFEQLYPFPTTEIPKEDIPIMLISDLSEIVMEYVGGAVAEQWKRSVHSKKAKE